MYVTKYSMVDTHCLDTGQSKLLIRLACKEKIARAS